jgi:hypothetical protein
MGIVKAAAEAAVVFTGHAATVIRPVNSTCKENAEGEAALSTRFCKVY